MCVCGTVHTVLSESFVTWFCTRNDVGQRLALHARRDCNSLSQQDAQSVSRFHTLTNFNAGQNDSSNRKAIDDRRLVVPTCRVSSVGLNIHIHRNHTHDHGQLLQALQGM